MATEINGIHWVCPLVYIFKVTWAGYYTRIGEKQSQCALWPTARKKKNAIKDCDSPNQISGDGKHRMRKSGQKTMN